MNTEKIVELEKLLRPVLGETRKIVDHSTKRLTSAGENYGSLMLAVDITAKTPNGSDEIIYAVAKLIPPNDLLQKLFHTPLTFPNEIGCYNTMFPTLRRFQEEQGMEELIDFTAKYYGSRLSLDPNSKNVDSGAALILENLKAEGFVNVERTVGCDLETSQLIIKDLATLHAVPLALKLLKPQIFQEKIKPFLLHKDIFELGDQVMREKINEEICRLVETSEEISALSERVKKNLASEPFGRDREPWATVSHNDCWVNNTMVKLSGNRPVKTKLVDFQVCDYGSPAKDIVFFLFTSVQTHLCQKFYQEFIQLYYETFLAILKKLKCDTSRFTFEGLLKEIDYEAVHSQFSHITIMLQPIFAAKGVVKEIEEISQGDFEKNECTQAYMDKLEFVVKEFARRNWI